MMALGLSVMAERGVFESRFDMDAVDERNVSAGPAETPGRIRIYYRGPDGSLETLVYEPRVNFELTVQTVVRKLPPLPSDSGSQESATPHAQYAYEYTIQSGQASVQPVRTFVVYMALNRGTPLSLTTPGREWYSRTPDPIAPAPNWVRWATSGGGRLKPEHYIQPGERVDGFELRGPGIPGILDAFAQGVPIHRAKLNEYVYVPRGPGEDVAGGPVVGPVPAPDVLDPVGFAQYVEELYHQSEDLGWINAPEAAATTLQRLEAARASLEGGDTDAAKRHLLDSVEHIRRSTEDGTTESVFTSEAEGLLISNVEYLLDRL